MTVAEEATDTAADLPVAQQPIDELHSTYWSRLVRFAWTRLDAAHRHLAEDMAQEAFIDFWRQYLLKGTPVERPFGLLCAMVRSRMFHFYDSRMSAERVVDFADPVNTPFVAAAATYTPGTPGLAKLAADLDAAMDTMTTASLGWREANKEHLRLHRRYAGQPATGRQEAQLQRAAQAEDAALLALQAACQKVGNLRGDLEAETGASWRACPYLPYGSDRGVQQDGHRMDDLALPSHCEAGHEFTWENSYYRTSGHRGCRTCRIVGQRDRRAVTRGKASAEPKRLCAYGHAETPENVYLEPSSGRRRCRPCRIESKRRARALKAERKLASA